MKNTNAKRKLPASLIATVLIIAIIIAGLSVYLIKKSYNPKTVLTINGEDISCGKYLYYQQSTLIDLTAEIYQATGRSFSSASDILSVTYADGTTIEERLKTELDEKLKETAFVNDELKARGIELTSNELYYYNYLASDNWANNSEYYLANGIGYETYRDCYLDLAKMSLLFNALYSDENSEYYISEDDIKSYYDNEYVSFDLITMPSTNSNSEYLNDEEIANVTVVAEKIAEALKDPKADTKTVFDDLFVEALQAANRTPEIKDSTYSAYLKSDNLTYYSDTNSFNYTVLDELRESQIGDTGVITYTATTGAKYIFVYAKHSHNSEGTEWEAYSQAILEQITEEQFSKFLSNGAANYTTVYDDKAVAYYSPYKIDINH